MCLIYSNTRWTVRPSLASSSWLGGYWCARALIPRFSAKEVPAVVCACDLQLARLAKRVLDLVSDTTLRGKLPRAFAFPKQAIAVALVPFRLPGLD